MHTAKVATTLSDLTTEPDAGPSLAISVNTPSEPARAPEPQPLPGDAVDFQSPSEGGRLAVEMTPLDVAKRAAVGRKKALEGINAQSAAVVLKSLKRLSLLLDSQQKVTAKELAVIAGIGIDRFLTTAASLEQFTGQSGVPGALDHFNAEGDNYREKRQRSETELKRILKVVRWRDRESAVHDPEEEKKPQKKKA